MSFRTQLDGRREGGIWGSQSVGEREDGGGEHDCRVGGWMSFEKLNSSCGEWGFRNQIGRWDGGRGFRN